MKIMALSLSLVLSFVCSGYAMAQDNAVEGLAGDLEQAEAQPRITRKVEPVPELKNLYHVSANKTPSGFMVPRFVSLKFSKVNGRKGPSLDHPIAWQYQRRGLPLLVVAETEMWRKVRDISGDESWMRKPSLSGERFALALTELNLRHRPQAGSNTIAVTEKDALLKLEECNDEGWCRVRSETGIRGWTYRDSLWGAQRLN